MELKVLLGLIIMIKTIIMKSVMRSVCGGRIGKILEDVYKNLFKKEKIHFLGSSVQFLCSSLNCFLKCNKRKTQLRAKPTQNTQN